MKLRMPAIALFVIFLSGCYPGTELHTLTFRLPLLTEEDTLRVFVFKKDVYNCGVEPTQKIRDAAEAVEEHEASPLNNGNVLFNFPALPVDTPLTFHARVTDENDAFIASSCVKDQTLPAGVDEIVIKISVLIPDGGI